MICVAISEKNADRCLKILDRIEMAEIRIDLTDFDEADVRKVFAHPIPKVATCRAEQADHERQFVLLSAAMETGAKYVDIEIEAGEGQIKRIAEQARRYQSRLIISYHNFDDTPATDTLNECIDQCFLLGADVAKIATQVNSTGDCARLLSLYKTDRPLIVLGMGALGKLTRIAAPFLGAEFTFAGMDDGRITAPGQIPYSDMKAIIHDLNKHLK